MHLQLGLTCNNSHAHLPGCRAPFQILFFWSRPPTSLLEHVYILSGARTRAAASKNFLSVEKGGAQRTTLPLQPANNRSSILERSRTGILPNVCEFTQTPENTTGPPL
jgi:hypothetical protein